MSLLFSSELNIYSIKIYKIMKTLQCSVLVKGPHQIFAAELAGAVADEGAAGDDAVQGKFTGQHSQSGHSPVAELLQGVEHVVGRRVELHPAVPLSRLHQVRPGGDLCELLAAQPLHHTHAVPPPLSH